MFNDFDFLRHMVLCMHPLGFFFMSVKEIIDVSNNYVEVYDWLANFIGLTYYFLISTFLRNIMQKSKRVSARLS